MGLFPTVMPQIQATRDTVTSTAVTSVAGSHTAQRSQSGSAGRLNIPASALSNPPNQSTTSECFTNAASRWDFLSQKAPPAKENKELTQAPPCTF